MKRQWKADDYAVLMYIGAPEYGKKREYWITLGGHAHNQALSGLPVGALGTRHGSIFN